eukprot:scaffold57768_cov25-Tisochrysis_lutea.AAC.6
MLPPSAPPLLPKPAAKPAHGVRPPDLEPVQAVAGVARLLERASGVAPDAAAVCGGAADAARGLIALPPLGPRSKLVPRIEPNSASNSAPNSASKPSKSAPSPPPKLKLGGAALFVGAVVVAGRLLGTASCRAPATLLADASAELGANQESNSAVAAEAAATSVSLPESTSELWPSAAPISASSPPLSATHRVFLLWAPLAASS